MWTEAKNRSSTVNTDGNSSKIDTGVTRQLFNSYLQTNGSATAATRPSGSESPVTKQSSGIIPGAIAATVFIAFILALYAVLWKCMVSPPQRKHSKVRVRIQQKNSA
ncbi:hypothetical protein EXN66_Car011234 [Channa argus]|uniref:Uncharacterized protein n=1 Tax=Channa argus TaxID=215402 RepID=A0A6G1PZX8_CHAAH|nr:hypothetical protein EXN66_Car011234 [Channa argus]KAK2901868.1 hypothetical protein Q8A73_011614 [Channa argus]